MTTNKRIVIMNKNISRISMTFAGGAMIAAGGAGIAQAASTPGDDKPLITQEATISGTPHKVVDAKKQADESSEETTEDGNKEEKPSSDAATEEKPTEDGGDKNKKDDSKQESGKIPGWAIQSATINILKGEETVKEDASTEDVKAIKGGSVTVQGIYKLKIPDSAKVGDVLDIHFFNGEKGDWKQNLRPIEVNGEQVAVVESDNGQDYRVKITKDVCSLEVSFSLVSNIDGETDEKNQFDYTRATKAPKDAQWSSPQCQDSEVTVTKTKHRPFPVPIPQTSQAPKPSASNTPATPQTQDTNDDAGYVDNGPALTPFTPVTAGPAVKNHDHQTVISGGGFTDDSKARNPQWNRLGGGESISAEDDKKGPEVKTGGAGESHSFFAKIAQIFN